MESFRALLPAPVRNFLEKGADRFLKWLSPVEAASIA